MASSMLTGERRWASARRSGMTVLGKVAVPKPINLPSQRLENHGVDPNVEIVPKGTLSWGSKSSSSTSNAWGSSTLSPNADGGTSSPSHHSGRPSSGGSGTRPSTAGSDRGHEPIANAWGSNSRPSSASGTFTSNQTSLASLRPRSAETRPGSSQLSRFAEPLTDNSVAWGSADTAEKLGVTSTKNDEFSLRSGDFPTLGSEKDGSGKNTEPKDHDPQVCENLSSDGVAPVKESTGTSLVGDVSGNANVNSVNSWRRDNVPYGEDGIRPCMEKRQADPQPYPGAGIPPQHYDAWHSPPIHNHPGGVWYRGPPGGPPYGTPVAPSGFPMEPFPFYRPQIPATALANQQPVPPPGAGPRGHHPKNGDMYRPHIPEAYIRPGMPMRPGFYPGPVPFDGYYGPPMGFCNSNEREIPYMGMAGGPPAYNRYPGHGAPDPGNSHAKSGGYGPAGKVLVSEQMELGNPHDTRGPYKVLLKQHNVWDEKNEDHEWEDTVTASAPYVQKRDQLEASSHEDQWRANNKNREEMDLKRMTLSAEASFKTFDDEGGASVPVNAKLSDSVGRGKAVDDISGKRSVHASSAFPEVQVASKDSSLIQKIEGLNAKARASDGLLDASSVSIKEEHKNVHMDSFMANQSVNEIHTGPMAYEKMPDTAIINPTSHGVDVSAGGKILDTTMAGRTTYSRRSTQSMHGRTDHRGKGRVNIREVEGWQKNTPVADSSRNICAAHHEACNNDVQVDIPVDANEKSGSYSVGKEEVESTTTMFDPIDSQSQRAKMKELAQQRVKQRQKEEEERARDQKAKALAKLEELNRRTQAAEDSIQKLETVLSSAIQAKKETSQGLAESSAASKTCDSPSSAPVSDTNLIAQITGSGDHGIEKPTILSSELPLETPKGVDTENFLAHNQSVSLLQNTNNVDTALGNDAQHINDVSVSRQKRSSYKQKRNITSERSSTEKGISTDKAKGPTINANVTGNVAASVEVVASEIASCHESSLPANPSCNSESAVHQKKKNNRSGRNRHKVEEARSVETLPVPVSKEPNHSINLGESDQTKSSESMLASIPVQADGKDGNQPFEQHPSSPNDEARARVNNQWKSQHSRRMPRNTQASRTADKFHNNDAVVWAPVRSQPKTEVTEEASQKTLVEAVASSVKSDHQVQSSSSNSRNKRAEMERYIPKPVAKELAQHGGCQQPLAPTNVSYSDAITGKVDSGSHDTESSQVTGLTIGNIGISVVSRNGDNKQNKQGGHGSWRQRGPIEQAIVQGVQEGDHNLASNSSRNTQKLIPQKPDVSSLKEEPKCSDEWNTSDGWNMPEAYDAASSVPVPVAKDQGGTARGKRHSFRGSKGSVGNLDLDHKKNNIGEADKIGSEASLPETGQTDLLTVSKENRSFGDRWTSHWQPKSHSFSASNQRESRPREGQDISPEVGKGSKKNIAPQNLGQLPPQQDMDAGKGMALPHRNRYEKGNNVEEVSNDVQPEARREGKTASFKGRPNSPNQGPVSPVELAPLPNMDNQHEQRLSSGFRKNGNQTSRPGRGHESRGEWSSSGVDNKLYNQPANRERQRQNTHYEYQPIGSYNNKANNIEGSKEGSYGSGPRFRETGHSNSRRGGGNFHGR